VDHDRQPASPCVPCPAGSYSRQGATACLACPRGTVDADGDAATLCRRCAPGQFEKPLTTTDDDDAGGGGGGAAAATTTVVVHGCVDCARGRHDHDERAATPCVDSQGAR
jgi:hypothetical protein